MRQASNSAAETSHSVSHKSLRSHSGAGAGAGAAAGDASAAMASASDAWSLSCCACCGAMLAGSSIGGNSSRSAGSAHSA